MKTRTKILIAALFALCVIFSLTVSSFAVDPGSGSITITNSNEAVSMNGHTYKAYKIFDVDYNEATPTDFNYTIATPFIGYFQSKNLSESTGMDLDARAYAYVASISGDEALQAFARDLYDNYIATGTDAVAASGSVTATGTTYPQSATIENLDPGYYLVFDAGTNASEPSNAEKAIANIALDTAKPDATIVLKASVPTIDKKITGVSDSSSNDVVATGSDGVDAKINQHVGFQIDSIVPDLTGYTKYTYKFTDTMSKGLIPDENVIVTIGPDATHPNPVVVNADCTISYAKNSEDKWVTTVSVPFNTLKQFAKDTPVTVTYSAKVSADANVYPSSTDPNTNDAVLTYSNNFNDETSSESTPSSKVNIYLFSLDVTKVNAKNEKLAGAKFLLLDKDGNNIALTQDTTTGRYKIPDAPDAATATDPATVTDAQATVVSDANGKIYIDGLAAGKYFLKEIEAPEGYNLLKDPFEINITAQFNDNGDLTGVAGNVATIINKAGGLLPSTGGIGTYIFTIGGAFIMIVSAYTLVFRKKKNGAK